MTKIKCKDNVGDCLFVMVSVGGRTKTYHWEIKLRLTGQRSSNIIYSGRPSLIAEKGEKQGLIHCGGGELVIHIHSVHSRSCFVFITNCRWCLYCNGYLSGKWTRWPDFKSWIMMFVFPIMLISFGKVCIQLFYLQLQVNGRADWAI